MKSKRNGKNKKAFTGYLYIFVSVFLLIFILAKVTGDLHRQSSFLFGPLTWEEAFLNIPKYLVEAFLITLFSYFIQWLYNKESKK